MLTKRSYQCLALSFYLIVLLFLTLYTLKLTGGYLIYSLDDPYIHLAVAENILRGGYGVNLSEYSSPSSSILYPFILAGTTYLGFGDWGPFFVTSLSMALAVWFASGFFWRYGVKTQQKAYTWLFFVTPPLIVLTVNAFSLVFTGLEHSLSVLASILVIAGLVKMIKGGHVSLLLIIGIILLGSTRFETIPFALMAIFVLLWQRHFAAGFITAAIILTILTAHGLFMAQIGLHFLPSSVLAKSTMSSAATDHSLTSMFIPILKNFMRNLRERWILVLLIGAVFLFTSVLAAYDARKKLPRALRDGIYAIGGIATMVLVAHCIGSPLSSFGGRYETYAFVIMVLGLVYVYSPGLTKINGKHVQAFMIPALLLNLNSYSVKAVYNVPFAARNIYEQQYQMHRFVTEYFPYPIAVNDLGWVSYKNDTYVFDLWGLGSEKARKVRYSPTVNADDIKKLVATENITFAMVYDEWFPGLIPNNWCRIASLKTSLVSAASDTVAFYLIDRSKEDAMKKALEEFRKTLPSGSTVTIDNKCSSL